MSIHVSHIAQGRSGITTPLHIAAGANFSLSSGLMLHHIPGISKGLADETVVARLNQTLLWDAMRPLEENCTLELLKWNADNKLVQKVCLTAAVDVPKNDSLQQVFWHSTAHLLGNALELRYPDTQLCDGPAGDQGFFYELAVGNSVSVSDLPSLVRPNARVIVLILLGTK